MRTFRIALLSTLCAALCAGAVYAALDLQSPAPAPTVLASYAPPGALLAIESPDFSTLLTSWNRSPELSRWLASDDYAGFSRSRLFSRLSDARDQFAQAAGLSPDNQFLQQIAGGKSLFAWYDIGGLEFLYITRLPADRAANIPLLQLRDHFEQREAGAAPFYVRTSEDPNGGPPRTVAWAVRGDYLLLATRADLLAGALQLMQQPEDSSLQHEPWYSNTVAAAGQPGDLRMTLDLTSIVRSPYFRSYWIQRNITDMKQYTAASSDLYLSAGDFREERVLIPADPATPTASADLSPVLAYLPANLGVYRAIAAPSASVVLTQLEDKLLSRQPGTAPHAEIAPVADLSTALAGDDAAFEQRIDSPILVEQPVAASLAPLRSLLASSTPSGMLTFSTASNPTTTESVFTPIHNAVVLAAAAPWSATALQQSVATALSPRLSIGSAGLAWTEHRNATSSWYELSGLNRLALYVHGNICILASDPATLRQLLSASSAAAPATEVATTIAGFNHASERAPFLRLTAVLDHSTAISQADAAVVPPFFSANMASLSTTFQNLDEERFAQSSTSGHVVRQTVLYRWHR